MSFSETFNSISDKILESTFSSEDIVKSTFALLSKNFELQNLLLQDRQISKLWKEFWDLCKEPEDSIEQVDGNLEYDSLSQIHQAIKRTSAQLIQNTSKYPILSKWIEMMPFLSQFYEEFLIKAQELEEKDLLEHLSPKAHLYCELFDKIYRIPQHVALKLTKRTESQEQETLYQFISTFLLEYTSDTSLDGILIATTQISIPIVNKNKAHLVSIINWKSMDSQILEKRQEVINVLLEMNEITQDFIDRNTEVKPTSIHHVVGLPEKNPLVYYKMHENTSVALNPGKEYMISSLYQILKIDVPQTGLIIIDQVKKGKVYTGPYIFHASEAIAGQSSTQFILDGKSLDLASFSDQFLGALLTNPSDGKPDNYIVNNNNKIVPIDNDLTFQPTLFKGLVHVKSILYFLPERNSIIHKDVVEKLKCLSPELVVLLWKSFFDKKILQWQSLKDRYEIFRKNFTEWSNMILDCSKYEIYSIVYKKLTLLQANFYFLKTCNQMLEFLDPTLFKVNQFVLKIDKTPIQAIYRVWEDFSVYKAIPEYETPDLDLDLTTISEFVQSLTDKPFQDEILTNPSLDYLVVQLKQLDALGIHRFTDQMALTRAFKKIFTRYPNQAKTFFEPFASQNPSLAWMMKLEENFSSCEKVENSRFCIQGASSGYRMLPNQCSALLDSLEKDVKISTLRGRSVVIPYPEKNPLFYFKKYPEVPGYEYATSILLKMLGICQGIPNCELYAFRDSKNRKYPVLVMEAINGDTMETIWNKSNSDAPLEKLDSLHTGIQILVAMLINPEDGKEDNFILLNQRYLCPIDNDHAFLPVSLQKNGIFYITYLELQTKTLLFCLSMMYENIPIPVKKVIRWLNPFEFVKKFLKDIMVLSYEFSSLFSEKEQKDLFLENNVILRIPIHENFVKQFYGKLCMMQMFVNKDKEDTYMNLLTLLEPFVAQKYKASFVKKTCKDRFNFVTSGLYQDLGNKKSVYTSREMMKIMNIKERDLIGVLSQIQQGPESAFITLDEIHKESEQILEVLKGRLDSFQVIDLKGVPQDKGFKMIVDHLVRVNSSLSIHNGTHMVSIPSDVNQLLRSNGHMLKLLDLRTCKLENQAFETISTYCINLEYLNVSGWNLTKLENFQEAKGKDLGLYMPETPIFINLTQLIANNLEKCVSFCLHLPSLKRISFEGPKCIDFSINAPNLTNWKLSLPFNNMKSLQMKDVTIQDYLSVKFEAFMSKEETIREARAISSSFGDIIKKIIENDPSLTQLFLDWYDNFYKDIGVIGANIIYKSLLRNTNLKILDLSYNKIGDSGLEWIAKALMENSSLKTLNLLDNNITDLGAEMLCKVLEKNSSLESLGLKGNRISPEFKEKIQTIWNKRSVYLFF